MLSTNVKTTSDLMSIALQAEREAIRRYSLLAATMRADDNKSTAELFERMVTEEQEHERLLLEWMSQEGIEENPDIGPISWKDPNVSTIYNNEARDPYQSSPYKALAFAVHNEEIAFRFYTHVAAESDNETICKYAEVLAREELGHAALLRAKRRQAYHAERKNIKTEPILDPRTISNEVDMLTVATHIDRYLLSSMNAITENSSLIEPLISKTQQELSSNEKNLSDKPEASEGAIRMLEQLDSYNAYLDKSNNGPDSELKRLWFCCDRSFAFYDAIVETAIDEDLMLCAQKLTVSALDRIGVLKQAFGSLSNADDSVT